MIGLAAGVVWAGYAVVWFGHFKLKGCDVRIAELVVPGRYAGCKPFGGASEAPATPGSAGQSGFTPGAGQSAGGANSTGGGGGPW